MARQFREGFEDGNVLRENEGNQLEPFYLHYHVRYHPSLRKVDYLLFRVHKVLVRVFNESEVFQKEAKVRNARRTFGVQVLQVASVRLVIILSRKSFGEKKR